FFDTVAVMQRQLLQCRPLLPVMANELPFVLADRTSWRRLRGLAKLRSALYADKVLHPPPNLLPQPPRRTGERPLRSEERGIFWQSPVAVLVSSAGTETNRRSSRRAPLQPYGRESWLRPSTVGPEDRPPPRGRIEPAPVISRSICGGFPMYSTLPAPVMETLSVSLTAIRASPAPVTESSAIFVCNASARRSLAPVMLATNSSTVPSRV